VCASVSMRVVCACTRSMCTTCLLRSCVCMCSRQFSISPFVPNLFFRKPDFGEDYFWLADIYVEHEVPNCGSAYEGIQSVNLR